MVKIFRRIFFLLFANPLFSAAVICAILFYSHILTIKDRNAFLCLFKNDSIIRLEGKLCTNPVKSSNKKNYSAEFMPCWAYSCDFGKTSCKGSVRIFIPSDLVESCYPGKIYTKTNSSAVLFESGNNLVLDVKNIEFSQMSELEKPIFSVQSAFSTGFSNSFWGKILKFRALCRLQFKRLMYGWSDAGGLLLALLSGSREYTEDSLGTSFKKAGLSHILALSGMHLGLFGGIAFLVGNRILRRNIADLIELCAILFFVWFAGLSPSLFRALLSAIILFINSTLRMNRFKGITVLSASFLIHILIFPEHLTSPAFMLSYAALFGIMSVAQIIKKILSKKLFPKLSADISDSLGAQIFTAPITLKIFGFLTPVGIISTIFVSPLVILFLYTGLLGTIICLAVPFLADAFSGIMSLLYGIIKVLVEFFARFPFLDLRGTYA